MKICAGIVTYNPDINLLSKAIASIALQVGKVIVVDNQSKNVDSVEGLTKQKKNILFIRNNNNLGIATALNQIGEIAEEKGFEWFLTLDQDSECSPNMIEIFSKYMEDSSVGMISPTIHLRIHGKDKPKLQDKYEYADTVITSGCLVKVEAWKSINGFWDYLFIDKVDDDFCYTLREKGWKILRTSKVVLEHQIGNPSKHKFLWKSYYIDSYPSFRYYYIARNTIIVYHIHKNTGYHSPVILCKKFVKIIFGENRKMSKLTALFSGMMDGLKRICTRKGRM